jgi:Glycosyl hydrolase family 65 central catalytic domain
MLFYLFSAEELGALFKRLGYHLEPEAIPRNVAYYDCRSSHGSTLSRVVHAWVWRARTGRAQCATSRRLCRATSLISSRAPLRRAARWRDRGSHSAHNGGYRNNGGHSTAQSAIAGESRAPGHAHSLPWAFARSTAHPQRAYRALL